jgi:surfactin synthase thioesterase subunit
MKTARALSPEMQDEIARLVLAYAGRDEAVIELTADEVADLVEAQAERMRGDFAPTAEVEAVLSKYRL